MPAKEPAGGVSPVVKSDFVPLKFPFTPKAWFTDRLLILVTAIFLLVLILFLSPEGKSSLQKILNQTPAQKIGLETSKLFENSYDKDRFEEFINSSQLAKAFIFLSESYDQKPSPVKRSALVKLADYIKANVPEQAKEVDLTIPCKEESCGVVLEYSDDLRNLKDKIEKEDSIDKFIKDSILQNIDNVALTNAQNNKVSSFNSLMNVFNTLKSEWQRTQDTEIKNLAQQTLSLLEKTDKQFYDFFKEKSLLDL